MIRKQTKKTTVVLWAIGDMAAGDEAELLVTVNGTIKGGASSDTELFVSGSWSAKYTDGSGTVQKSEYAGRVSVTVTSGP